MASMMGKMSATIASMATKDNSGVADMVKRASDKTRPEPNADAIARVCQMINSSGTGDEALVAARALKMRLQTSNRHKQWMVLQTMGNMLNDCPDMMPRAADRVGLFTEVMKLARMRVLGPPDAKVRTAALELVRSAGDTASAARGALQNEHGEYGNYELDTYHQAGGGGGGGMPPPPRDGAPRGGYDGGYSDDGMTRAEAMALEAAMAASMEDSRGGGGGGRGGGGYGGGGGGRARAAASSSALVAEANDYSQTGISNAELLMDMLSSSEPGATDETNLGLIHELRDRCISIQAVLSPLVEQLGSMDGGAAEQALCDSVGANEALMTAVDACRQFDSGRAVPRPSNLPPPSPPPAASQGGLLVDMLSLGDAGSPPPPPPQASSSQDPAAQLSDLLGFSDLLSSDSALPPPPAAGGAGPSTSNAGFSGMSMPPPAIMSANNFASPPVSVAGPSPGNPFASPGGPGAALSPPKTEVDNLFDQFFQDGGRGPSTPPLGTSPLGSGVGGSPGAGLGGSPMQAPRAMGAPPATNGNNALSVDDEFDAFFNNKGGQRAPMGQPMAPNGSLL